MSNWRTILAFQDEPQKGDRVRMKDVNPSHRTYPINGYVIYPGDEGSIVSIGDPIVLVIWDTDVKRVSRRVKIDDVIFI